MAKMDPKIAALKNAKSSAQLKAAVDAIPRDDKYYTAEIRDAILQKKNLIVDASSADAVASFLSEFSRIESTRPLLRTAEIRDLFIDVLAPKISDGDPVENLGAVICCITCENKPAAELYSNRKSFFAILPCFHRAPTAESVIWIANSINSICLFNPGANNILNDLPVVEAYSAISPHATTSAAVSSIVSSIAQILRHNVPAKKMFGTPVFYEKFKSMKQYDPSEKTLD